MNITIDQAIESIETHMEVHKIGEYPHVMIGEALNMAIAALRAQQTTARLDRSRWDGCRLCSGSDRPVWFCIYPQRRKSGV